jgi:hypothetical protein
VLSLVDQVGDVLFGAGLNGSERPFLQHAPKAP